MSGDEMELELKDDKVREDKQTQLEKMIEKNTEEVVDILREKDYEIIEPLQKKKPTELTETRKKGSEKTRVIGFSGKGGVGKTTLAALFLRALTEMKDSSSILAVDSDPNTCFPDMLGADNYKTLSQMIEGYKGGRLPPRKLKQEFNTLLLKNEQENFDLLPMGKSEGQGCYCSVNNLLRSAFHDFVLEGRYAYDYVVFDCEAGIEHLSRKTSAFINDLIIISDGSKMSIDTIKNIYETGKDVKIEIKNLYTVANRMKNEKVLEKIKKLSEKLGIKYLGGIPEDENLKELNFKGESVFKLSKGSPAFLKMKKIAKEII